MTVQKYVEELNRHFKSGISSEHTYRGDLQNLLESILPDILVTNEPKRSDVGAPDYILTKGNIPIGYVEAKDIDDPDLSGKKKNKEQFSRYKDGLPNIIFTDYLEFHLYQDREAVTLIRIAEVVDGEIKGLPGNYDQFRDLINEFGTHIGQTIRSANKLSKMMAGKARLLSTVIEKAINVDEKESEDGNLQANNTLREQLAAFQNILIHDIDAKEFADIYAQTIAYGMFAARLNDRTLDTFSRYEASELIPKTNPFLRRLFGYIAGPDIDERIVWIVDGLADVFRATDVDGLLKNFGRATKKQDPIIHFYETFLTEYDKSQKVQYGVWYTPEPVVNFIVRAVDDILKDDFDLKKGIADTSKTKIKVNTDIPNKKSTTGYKQVEREVHKVQILDPATGTGTFLAEVVEQIYSQFQGQEGLWKQYVEQHLIPRLNGFEILMASYAMAHLKLDLLLRETGIELNGSQRFKIYLTNTLEEYHPNVGTFFANWLSQEANEANYVKRDTPVMVVLGNPPYQISSQNKGKWILDLLQDYKKDLNEKKINLDDDYIKFIRYGQYLVEKNNEGILAFITNNSYLEGVTHRKMRSDLLNVFDKIFILNLHGNSEKAEVNEKGERDINVFDIKQGVSINIFVKANSHRGLGKIFYKSLVGPRQFKNDQLLSNGISSIDWEILNPTEPYYFYIPKDFSLLAEYEQFISTQKLFPEYSSGVQTKRDDLTIRYTNDELNGVIDYFQAHEIEEIRKYFSLPKDGRDWKISYAKSDLKKNNPQIINYSYRPFDLRKTIFTGNSKGFLGYPRTNIMANMLNNENIGILLPRQALKGFHHVFLTTHVCDINLTGSSGKYGGGLLFPLYTYTVETNQQTLDGKSERTPNLDKKIIQKIVEKLGLTFTSEKEGGEGTFAPIDLLDYIYAVLHSANYREKYKEFLKIDFPRVPYPDDQEKFWQLVERGGKLRQVHLLEHPVIENYITTYPELGSNIVTNRLTKPDPGFIPDEDDESIGKVWINEEQYFGNVPKKAWEFYIGGYQPAEKWLKDRRGRELSIEEIYHYQKIIVALMETDRLMQEIDEVGVIDDE